MRRNGKGANDATWEHCLAANKWIRAEPASPLVHVHNYWNAGTTGGIEQLIIEKCLASLLYVSGNRSLGIEWDRCINKTNKHEETQGDEAPVFSDAPSLSSFTLHQFKGLGVKFAGERCTLHKLSTIWSWCYPHSTICNENSQRSDPAHGLVHA